METWLLHYYSSAFVMLWSLYQLCGPSLGFTGKPKAGHNNPQVWPYWYWAEGKDQLPWPAGSGPPNAAQDALCVTASQSAGYPSGPSGLFLQNCCPAGETSAYTSAWGWSLPGAGFCSSLCWTCWCSCWSIFSVCSGASEWHHVHLVCQQCFPVLYHQWISTWSRMEMLK